MLRATLQIRSFFPHSRRQISNVVDELLINFMSSPSTLRRSTSRSYTIVRALYDPFLSTPIP
jgi:hypothetical protein